MQNREITIICGGTLIAEKVFINPGLKLVWKTGELAKSVMHAKGVQKEGADIIISLEGTTKMIPTSVSLPVIWKKKRFNRILKIA